MLQLSTSSNPPDTTIPEGRVPRCTTPAVVSHYAETPNLAFRHARTIQPILEDIFLRYRCYGTYAIHTEFDENMARTGQGLLEVIVISLDAVWCSKKMEHEIGLAVWPFVTKLHMKPLPLPSRTIKVVPIAPGASDPSTDVNPGPSPTLIPFLGRNDDAHVPRTRLYSDDDNGVDTLSEIEHVDNMNSTDNSQNWQLPIHSSIEGDYAMSLDSRINVEAAPGTGNQSVHFDSDGKSEHDAMGFPRITVSITPLQLAIPRVIDERTARLVPLSKLPMLITSNIRARLGRVLNLNLPQDHRGTLQAISYIVKDNDSTHGTISSVEKSLLPVSVRLKQGHVDIHGSSCNAELDWCYNLTKPYRMHSITMKDPARATFILCGPRPDDWPMLDFDIVTVWRLQNEESTLSKIISLPCARARNPKNAYSHVAHRVSAHIDLDEMMHNHRGVSGHTDDTNETALELSQHSGSDVSHSSPRPAITKIKNGRSSSLQFMFMHALKGRVQRKKAIAKTLVRPVANT